MKWYIEKVINKIKPDSKIHFCMFVCLSKGHEVTENPKGQIFFYMGIWISRSNVDDMMLFSEVIWIY